MPRIYLRKSDRLQWSNEQMTLAIRSVLNGEKKIREAGREFGIPESTIRKRLKDSRSEHVATIGRKPTFTPSDEKELAEVSRLLAETFYGLTTKELRRLAFEFAETRHIAHRFNGQSRLAGKDWLYLFLKRNPFILIRKNKSLGFDRINQFSRDDITRYFDNLKSLMERFKFLPSRIFNMNEFSVNSIKEGYSMTTVFCISASGFYLPPLFVYPSKGMIEDFNGAEGAVYCSSPSGVVDETLFLDWLMHFKEHTRPSEQDPVLLIMDDSTSHISLAAFEFWQRNGIFVACLPPHTSHFTQPLDVAFFRTFRECLGKEEVSFSSISGSFSATLSDLTGLVTNAFIEEATPDKAITGFMYAGIFPLNEHILEDKVFAGNTFQPTGSFDLYGSCDSQNLTVIMETMESDSEYSDFEEVEMEMEPALYEEPLSSRKRGPDTDLRLVKKTRTADVSEDNDAKNGKVFNDSAEAINDLTTSEEAELMRSRNSIDSEVWFRCIKCVKLRYKGCIGDFKPPRNNYRCELCVNTT